jgi:hypothetical protein
MARWGYVATTQTSSRAATFWRNILAGSIYLSLVIQNVVTWCWTTYGTRPLYI